MSRYSRDLTKGSVAKNLFLFALPILFSNFLQQLYHSADVVVVGNFAENSKIALAAVGSTGTITNLLLNVFIGLSLGVNVVCANCYGARDEDGLQKSMQTGILTAAFGGLFISVLGFVFAKPLLLLLGSPASVIDHAATYMKIVFLGQPGSLIYNFGSGILRSHGDTKRPMYILSFSGLINVILNLVFVIVFHLDSAGVALATTISHYVSAAAVLYLLSHPAEEQKLDLFRLKFDLDMFKKVMKIGIPGGLNGMIFNLSALLVVKGINSLGDVVVAGNSAAASVDAFTYQILASFYSACVSFAGQNYGAKQFKRIDKLLVSSILMAGGIYCVLCGVILLFPSFFVGLFTHDSEVIAAGIPRLYAMGIGYLIYIVSDMCIGCLRGMGKSVFPTAVNVVSICLPRVLWVAFAFPLKRELGFLFLCFPISYFLSAIAQLGCYLYYSKKDKKAYFEAQNEKTQSA